VGFSETNVIISRSALGTRASAEQRAPRARLSAMSCMTTGRVRRRLHHAHVQARDRRALHQGRLLARTAPVQAHKFIRWSAPQGRASEANTKHTENTLFVSRVALAHRQQVTSASSPLRQEPPASKHTQLPRRPPHGAAQHTFRRLRDIRLTQRVARTRASTPPPLRRHTTKTSSAPVRELPLLVVASHQRRRQEIAARV